MPLQVHYHISSEMGLASVTTLIVGQQAAIIVDPPFLIPDAKSVAAFVKEKTSLPVKAAFVSHHHPDHFFGSRELLENFPGSKLYAHKYVLEGIEREYDEKKKYWPSVFGPENASTNPMKPEVYPYSFFILPGDEASPVFLMGPVQGDSIDHTLFWLPTERTLITGDAVYARSNHAWIEEVESLEVLHAWRLTLKLIESLKPLRVIPGHLETGTEPDAELDLAHMRKYLDLFETKIGKPVLEKQGPKPKVQEIWDTFASAFPQCQKNLDFFLGKLSNMFGEGGEPWLENRKHPTKERTKEQLEGFLMA